MENTLPFIICTAIVLFVSTVTSLITLWNILKKPAEAYKEKQDNDLKTKISETLNEVLPEILTKHDLETRDKYKADREKYLGEIKSATLTDIQGELSQVKLLGLQYESLVITTKDMLRENIMKIYINNRDDKALTVLDRERLDQFYKDYKSLKGNSYIDKYYNRMLKWKIIDDDYDEDDDL